MKEDFLHFVWRLRRFRQKGLQTTTGDAVEVLVPGQHNHNAGPDFLDARIRIGGTLWAGNVEMHLRSSQWLAHGHETDPNYDNVILHVVLEEDDAEDRRRALKAGADDYMVGPLDRNGVLDRIDSLAFNAPGYLLLLCVCEAARVLLFV